MRVLHVVATGQRRGAEMFAADLVGALAGIGGFEQEVALLHGPWPPAVPYEATVRALRTNGHRLPGLRMDLATLSSLRGTVTRFRPDVIHAHGGEAFKHLALVTAGRRTPVVYRRIGVAPEAVTRGLGRARQTALLRRSRLIVAVAEAVRRETVETFRVPRERVVVIPRGIDPGRLRPERGGTAVREELGIAPGRPVLISLGALSPEKAPLAHLDLLAALLPAVPEAVYLFAGDGPMRGELEEAVRSRGFGEHVRMLGSRADVGDLLDASDLLVLPSELEGMPGCVIEAGMVGVPVVAYGVAGVPEVVVDGVTGSVVAPGDREALAARALELLADEGRRRDLGRAAMERCRSLFDIHLIADRYAEVYAGAVRSAVEDGRQRERTRTLRRRRRAA